MIVIFRHISQAIGSRNLLKSIAKQREAQQQQLQALITERKMQLERFGTFICMYICVCVYTYDYCLCISATLALV